MLKTRLLVLFSVSCLLTSVFCPKAYAGETDLPSGSIPDSIGIQTKTHSCKTEDISGISELGAKWIRRGFYWQSVEPEKGKYVFTDYDRLFKDCDAKGIRILGCLFGNNKLYEDDGQGGIQTEAGRQGFAGFAAALAKRYKGRGIIWEVWNEPNIRSFWRKNGKHNSEEFAEEYTALVKEVVTAMKEKDPDVIVMAGSVSCFWDPSYEWTAHCFKKGIYKSGIKAWSVHPYGLKAPEESTVGYQKMRSIMKENGVPDDFPIINSERGFSSAKYIPPKGAAGPEGWSGGPAELAALYQSWFVVRQFLVDQMNGVRLSIWYQWSDKKFGLVDNNKKKPAYESCRVIIRELSGYSFKERFKTESDMDFVLLFTDGEGSEKLIAWTSFDRKSSPDKTKNHSIKIPVKVTSGLETTDLFGKKEKIKVENGKLQLNLTGAPFYVTLK